jgi:hypothetical protein
LPGPRRKGACCPGDAQDTDPVTNRSPGGDRPQDLDLPAPAHAVESKDDAYRRGDLFEKRRRLMQQWAAFCTTVPDERSKVVSLQGR